jgi:hypothetical protein
MRKALREDRPELLTFLKHPEKEDCFKVLELGHTYDGVGMLVKNDLFNIDNVLEYCGSDYDKAYTIVCDYLERFDSYDLKKLCSKEFSKKLVTKFPALVTNLPVYWGDDLIKYALDVDAKNPKNPNSFLNKYNARGPLNKDLINYIFSKTIKADYPEDVKADFCKTVSSHLNDFGYYLEIDNYDTFLECSFKKLQDVLHNMSYSSRTTLLSFCSDKMKMKILRKLPMAVKDMDSIPMQSQIQMIKKNPFNIRFIENPDKNVIEFAIKMNPDVKDYIFED